MRGPPVGLRELTAEEASAVDSLARSRTAAARRVERARMVWRAHQGETPPTLAETLGLSAETVRRRMRRFNTEGLAALEDHHRSGRRSPSRRSTRRQSIGSGLWIGLEVTRSHRTVREARGEHADPVWGACFEDTPWNWLGGSLS